jgi:hypothetical protein
VVFAGDTRLTTFYAVAALLSRSGIKSIENEEKVKVGYQRSAISYQQKQGPIKYES